MDSTDYSGAVSDLFDSFQLDGVLAGRPEYAAGNAYSAGGFRLVDGAKLALIYLQKMVV